jgi:hypothetical protein
LTPISTVSVSGCLLSSTNCIFEKGITHYFCAFVKVQIEVLLESDVEWSHDDNRPRQVKERESREEAICLEPGVDDPCTDID